MENTSTESRSKDAESPAEKQLQGAVNLDRMRRSQRIKTIAAGRSPTHPCPRHELMLHSLAHCEDEGDRDGIEARVQSVIKAGCVP